MPADPAPVTLDALFAAVPEAGPAPVHERILAGDVPEPFRSLLVHDQHMTEVMERRHAGPVRVEVQARRRAGDFYSRWIRLRRVSDDTVVQGGLVRIRLSLLPAQAAAAILKEETPLGRLLIDHHTLRRIDIRDYMRFLPQAPLEACLGPMNGSPTYGRLGWLHVGGQPAIELFEIIAPASVRPPLPPSALPARLENS